LLRAPEEILCLQNFFVFKKCKCKMGQNIGTDRKSKEEGLVEGKSKKIL
jgi:hypothetical protein